MKILDFNLMRVRLADVIKQENLYRRDDAYVRLAEVARGLIPFKYSISYWKFANAFFMKRMECKEEHAEQDLIHSVELFYQETIAMQQKFSNEIPGSEIKHAP